jgi:hypothetical protein
MRQRYRVVREPAMNSPLFDTKLVAALMSPPTPGYLALVERMRMSLPFAAALPYGGEAARHLAHFAERVNDLAEDELTELYEVSFVAEDASDLLRAARAIEHHGCAACSQALPVLQRLLEPLDGARNPFAALFKGLCCVMLTCRELSAKTAGPGIPYTTCPLESS